MTKELLCSASKTISSQLILPCDTNSYKTLYGGRLMELIDSIAFISFAKHTRRKGVTASIDELHFIAPLPEGDTLTIETYVSGTAHRSVEVFVKVIGETLATSQCYLAATAFITFVIIPDEQETFVMPKVVPQSKEEIYVCAGYEQRRLNRLNKRQDAIEFHDHLSITTDFTK